MITEGVSDINSATRLKEGVEAVERRVYRQSIMNVGVIGEKSDKE